MQAIHRPKLTFRFDGGDAAEGQLNFYDAGRFQYGAARFVYTLEYFRQTGQVLSKITRRVDADYRISTPTRGSFIMEVIQIAAPVIGEMAIKVPIHVLMAHVMEHLTPGKKTRELATEVLNERRSTESASIAHERERTAQEKERTEQVRLLTAPTSQALELVSKALEQSRSADPRSQILHEIQGELVASIEREALIQSYQNELSKISDSVMARLLDRTRSQVVEMGKPLIRSADRLEIGEGSVKSPLVSTNRRVVEELSGNTVDPLPSTLRGNITRFDKENGWGKFRNPEFSSTISFVVPSVIRNSLRDDVIDAMKKNEAELVFYYVRDKSGKVQYLIVDNLRTDLC
jgi:hypothetical protein